VQGICLQSQADQDLFLCRLTVLHSTAVAGVSTYPLCLCPLVIIAGPGHVCCCLK
jgi:hypothetical protein